MIKVILLACTLIFLSACSTSTPKNDWQIQSVNAYESHQKHFLQNDDSLSNIDHKRAIKYAKQSSDLTTLATIHLSECALHVSVLEEDSCQEYLSLEPLVKDDKLHSYYLFLQNNYNQNDIKNLPSKYRTFATYKLQKNYVAAQKEILASDDIISKMIMGSLMKDSLHVSAVKSIIYKASFYGYKKSVISWMEFYRTKTTDLKEKNIIEEKLKILKDSKR